MSEPFFATLEKELLALQRCKTEGARESRWRRTVPVGTALIGPPPGQNPACSFPAPGSHLGSAESEI